jgi:hypothetical protein
MSKKHDYRVRLEADFIEPAHSPSVLRGRLMKIIKRAGLSDTNFSIDIEKDEKTAQYNLNEDEKVLLGIDKTPTGRGKLTSGRTRKLKRKVIKNDRPKGTSRRRDSCKGGAKGNKRTW